MHEVQKMALAKALKTLDSLKDVIGYAVEVDGSVVGNRELKPYKEKGGKRNFRYERGETRRYYMPMLAKAKIGDVIEIPFGKFDPGVLCSNVSAACSHMYGKGNTTVFNNKAKGVLEVLISDMDPALAKYRQLEMFGTDDS